MLGLGTPEAPLRPIIGSAYELTAARSVLETKVGTYVIANGVELNVTLWPEYTEKHVAVTEPTALMLVQLSSVHLKSQLPSWESVPPAFPTPNPGTGGPCGGDGGGVGDGGGALNDGREPTPPKAKRRFPTRGGDGAGALLTAAQIAVPPT